MLCSLDSEPGAKIKGLEKQKSKPFGAVRFGLAKLIRRWSIQQSIILDRTSSV